MRKKDNRIIKKKNKLKLQRKYKYIKEKNSVENFGLEFEIMVDKLCRVKK